MLTTFLTPLARLIALENSAGVHTDTPVLTTLDTAAFTMAEYVSLHKKTLMKHNDVIIIINYLPFTLPPTCSREIIA